LGVLGHAFSFPLRRNGKIVKEDLIVCSCNHCSGKIEFESSHAGETVTCPHCAMETVLFASRKPIPDIERRSKIIVREKWFGGGVESQLDNLSMGILWLGVAIFLICVAVTIESISTDHFSFAIIYGVISLPKSFYYII
jgi:hypothetical protein